MKVSIVTVTKNSAKTIERTVKSVLLQGDSDVEHVIKDAGSNDNTLGIALTINPSVIGSTQFDIGIYDAMNQGYSISTGEIVAFLNSDDYYIDSDVISDVINAFHQFDCDFVYGDITMRSASGIVLREWKSGMIGDIGLVGSQIPHPGIFIKRRVLDQLVLPFDPTYRISADLKQQLLIINKFKLKGHYLNRSLVVMEIGGESTSSFISYIRGWRESARAYNEVIGSGGNLFVIRKVLSKLQGVRWSGLFGFR